MRYSKYYNIWHTWTILFHLWNGMDRNVKKKLFFIHFLFLLLWLFFLISLAFFFFLSLESPPLPYLLSLSLPFFLLISSQESSPLPFSFSFSFFLFFFSLSLSLSLLFSPPRSLPLRLAITMEFSLTNEVDWWRSHVSWPFFFFLVVDSMWLWVVVELGWFHVISVV